MNGTTTPPDGLVVTLSDTNGIHRSDSGNTVNARSLAQEVATWYIDRRHPYQTHASNVKEHLRGPMIALTAYILLPVDALSSTDREDTKAQKGTVAMSSVTTSGIGTDVEPSAVMNEIGMDEKQEAIQQKRNKWRQCLHRFGDASFSFHDLFSLDKTESIYDRMDIRSKARLDAFMDGVALAVVSDETQQPSKKGDPPQRQGSVDSTDLSLIEGLVGFRSLGITKNSTTMNVVSSIKQASRSSSITSATKSVPPPKPCPQLGEHELVTRLELYVRSISRVATYWND
jgi:hypothetical protein